MRRAVIFLVLAACGHFDLTGDAGLSVPDSVPGTPDTGPPPATFSVSAPHNFDEFTRSYLTAENAWVAEITFTAQGPATVSEVDWMLDGQLAGIGVAPDYLFITHFPTDGDFMIDAVAIDSTGAETSRITVHFSVLPTPSITNCAGTLDILGIPYVPGPTTPGIISPVTITLPINTIPFTASGTTTPRTTLVMDCSLAVALWRMTDALKEAGIVAITDDGVYAYTCADSSVQPPCTGSSLSSAAQGLAIDIAGFAGGDGTTYSVADDWVKDTLSGTDNTCTVIPAPMVKNIFMHELVCGIAQDAIFPVMLTPNYNASHRDHWHFDLTPQAMPVVLRAASR